MSAVPTTAPRRRRPLRPPTRPSWRAGTPIVVSGHALDRLRTLSLSAADVIVAVGDVRDATPVERVPRGTRPPVGAPLLIGSQPPGGDHPDPRDVLLATVPDGRAVHVSVTVPRDPTAACEVVTVWMPGDPAVFCCWQPDGHAPTAAGAGRLPPTTWRLPLR